MSGDYVIGVDCSTTAAKAVVWNDEGTSMSHARWNFDLSQPRPGWGEQNAEDWWAATAAAVRRAVQTVDASRIAAICVTHQRETFVCLDQAGAPLRPAMLWLDTRAIAEVQEYGTAEVHRITGKPPNPTPAWYKLLWLARHEPDTMQRVGKVVDVQAFLVHRLTGEWATSWASADPLGLVDMASFDYHDGLLDAVGLRRGQLSALHPPGSVLGNLTSDVASELGLAKRLPVVAGVGDGQSAQLGTGITAPGRAYLNLGTGIVSGTYSNDYSHGVEYRTLSAAVPGGYDLETFMGGGTVQHQLVCGAVLRTGQPRARAGPDAGTSPGDSCRSTAPRGGRTLGAALLGGRLDTLLGPQRSRGPPGFNRSARQVAYLSRTSRRHRVRAAPAHLERREGSRGSGGGTDRARRRISKPSVVPDPGRHHAASGGRSARGREHLPGLGHARRSGGRRP